MALLAITCLATGGIIGIIFGIQLLVVQFQTSVWWGLGSIFIPLVALFFLFAHWEVAKKPFLRGLIAVPFYVVGMLLMPA